MAGRWGLGLAGLILLVFTLVYGINRLIPVTTSPAVAQKNQGPLTATETPTRPPEVSAAPTAVAGAPLPGTSSNSQVRAIDQNGVASINLRACPSLTCAVVGELPAGQQASEQEYLTCSHKHFHPTT